MLIEKIKNFINKNQELNRKKTIENLVVFVIILIIVLLSINVIWNKDKKEDNKSTIDENKKLATIEENSKDDNSLTSEKLENILSKINGVGKVKVYITYSQTSQIIPIYNEDISQKDTQEEDTQGGTRKVVETDTKKEVVYDEKSGSKTIITQSIVSPKIEGAIVTAEGGNNTNTKANIIQAVEAVTRVTNTQNSSIWNESRGMTNAIFKEKSSYYFCNSTNVYSSRLS